MVAGHAAAFDASGASSRGQNATTRTAGRHPHLGVPGRTPQGGEPWSIRLATDYLLPKQVRYLVVNPPNRHLKKPSTQTFLSW